MNEIKIGDKVIGEQTYIIAECGVNHNGSLERAKDLIFQAAINGADAVKFQTYKAEDLVVKGTPKFWDWKGDKAQKDQFEAYKAIDKFDMSWYPELIEYCEENGVEFLSTAFSFETADYLNEIGMKAFKVASSDMSHLPYLKHIARFNKPIILSTGAATPEEVLEAVNTIENEGNFQIIILHCTLNYPTKLNEANLNLIPSLAMAFPQYPIGISDHTLGVTGSIVAAAMGACVIEKHFTVDKSLPDSADHWLSVDPSEMEILVKAVREVEIMKGERTKRVFESESETRKYDKRSIVSKVDIKKGDVITEDMLTYKRPGTGIWPRDLELVLGKVAKEDINADTTLQWTLITE